MIYRTLHAHDTSIRYDQTNNVIERVFLDLKNSNQLDFWLESCNYCAACCGVEAVGGEWRNQLPVDADGEVACGQDDLMFTYIFSTVGQRKIPRIETGVMENELIENLAYAVGQLTTAEAKVTYFQSTHDLLEAMIAALKDHHAVVLSYRTDYGTGHYICIVEYNADTDKFRAYDSWSGNIHCKNNGILETYNRRFFIERARPRIMEIAR